MIGVSCWCDVFDVRCYIIYYIIYYYTYIIILLLYYLILYSSSIFYSSLPPFFLFFPFLFPISSSNPSLTLLFSPISFILYVSVLPYTYLYSFTIFKDNPLLIYLPFFLSFPISSSLLFPSSLFILLQYSLPFHSRNTCRHLDPLIYILFQSDNSTPHVLSEWMVEV